MQPSRHAIASAALVVIGNCGMAVVAFAISSRSSGAAAAVQPTRARASTTFYQRWLQASRRAVESAALGCPVTAVRAIAALATATSRSIGAAATDSLARAHASTTLYQHWLQPSRRGIARLRRWQLRADQLVQQQLSRWQERAPPARSISAGCSPRAALSRRLHLGDWQLRVAPSPRWQLRADQLAQQQLTRWQEHAPPPRYIGAGCSRRHAIASAALVVFGSCGMRGCGVCTCEQINGRSSNCPADKSAPLHYALSALDAAVAPLLYMCCLSPCAQPFSPVVMTLVSELEVRGSNLSI